MKRVIVFFFLLLPLLVLAADDVRPYLSTGPWYPSDPARLRQMLDSFFSALPPAEASPRVRAIIAPHAGFEYSGRCAARAYRALTAGQGIRRVILMGSSHRSGFYGACVDDYEAWSTPLGTVAVDAPACRELARKSLFKVDRGAMRLEHSLENQLPFLQRVLPAGAYRIVPILFGSLKKADFAAMAAAVAPLIGDDTLVVVSSDLTHYGESFAYLPFRGDLAANLDKLDRGFIETILRLDFERCFDYREKTGITACGFVPIGVMIRLFEKRKPVAALAGYEKSGDRSGDYSTSVSYASLLFTVPGEDAGVASALDRGEQESLLLLARSTLRSFLQNGPLPQPDPERFSAGSRLAQKSGVFVTLRMNGALRGCIGSIVGVEPLFRGVMANAVHAATHDPRFPPLAPAELKGVEIEISVMTPLRPLADHRDIRLGTDGVVIRDGDAQAVFLPQVAVETGWDLDEFLGHLCLKAGLARDAYLRSPSLRFHVFQAQVFGEKEPRK